MGSIAAVTTLMENLLAALKAAKENDLSDEEIVEVLDLIKSKLE